MEQLERVAGTLEALHEELAGADCTGPAAGWVHHSSGMCRFHRPATCPHPVPAAGTTPHTPPPPLFFHPAAAVRPSFDPRSRYAVFWRLPKGPWV